MNVWTPLHFLKKLTEFSVFEIVLSETVFAPSPNQGPLNTPFLKKGLLSRDLREGKRPTTTMGKRPIMVGRRPIKEGKPPITLMASFRAPHDGG